MVRYVSKEWELLVKKNVFILQIENFASEILYTRFVN